MAARLRNSPSATELTASMSRTILLINRCTREEQVRDTSVHGPEQNGVLSEKSARCEAGNEISVLCAVQVHR